jgi:hypothetical protein
MQTEDECEKERKITIVESDIKANYILKEILNDKPCVIGVDTEAALEMSRFGILCLIQVIYYISLRLLLKSKCLYLT